MTTHPFRTKHAKYPIFNLCPFFNRCVFNHQRYGTGRRPDTRRGGVGGRARWNPVGARPDRGSPRARRHLRPAHPTASAAARVRGSDRPGRRPGGRALRPPAVPGALHAPADRGPVAGRAGAGRTGGGTRGGRVVTPRGTATHVAPKRAGARPGCARPPARPRRSRRTGRERAETDHRAGTGERAQAPSPERNGRGRATGTSATARCRPRGSRRTCPARGSRRP